MKSFQSTTAKILTTAFVGLVAFAFIFTFDTPQNFVGGGSIAKVEGHKVLPREFEREYNFQLKLLSFRMGGKDPTSKQIEESGLRKRALQLAIERKLYLLLAERSNIRSGPASIRRAVREYDFFQTDGEFDFIKYKDLLRVNGLTPSGYEKTVRQDLMAMQGERLSSYAPASKSFAREILAIQGIKRKVSVVQIRNFQMRKFIEVGADEVKQFLLSEKGRIALDKLFAVKKKSLGKEAEVRARHILFKGSDSLRRAKDLLKQKITENNFSSFAKKYSEDSTGSKGGDLGWFGRGRMVPEFEKVAFSLEQGKISQPVKTVFGHHLILITGRKEEIPAKMADHEKDLARELILKKKSRKIAELREKVARQFMVAGGKKSWKKISKKYSLSPIMNRSLSLFDDRIGSVTIAREDRERIFFGPEKNAFIGKGTDDKVSLVFQVLGKEERKKSAKEKEKDDTSSSRLEKELKSQRGKVAVQLKNEWMNQLWEESSISCLGMDIKNRKNVFDCNI